MDDTWKHAYAAYKWLIRSELKKHQHDRNMDANRYLRVVKLSEEVGEVAQALIGIEGQNPRKGVTHTTEDVASELCDVIVTAMVAMHDYVPNPQAFMAKYFEARSERLKQWEE